MRFNQLINALEGGEACLQSYELATNPELLSAAALDQANQDQISFLEKGNTLSSILNKSKAGAVLIPNDEKLIKVATQRGFAWATFQHPRLAFAESLEILYPRKIVKPEIHPTAFIGEGVELGKDVFLGPNVSIGNNCLIGNKTIIHSGVVLYEKVVIGEGCELHANCVLHPDTKIGTGCVINSNAVIGSEGFGFVPTNHGWHKMPQTGYVVLENEVEIGSNSTIDRPAVGETRIGAGTKIDNLVQVGHGVTTGKACAMAAQVGIAGGAKLGNGVILAGQVGVGNRVQVGDGVIASSKCGVHADIAPGEVVSGFPAIPNKLWLRCSANFKKLPEIVKSLREKDRRAFD